MVPSGEWDAMILGEISIMALGIAATPEENIRLITELFVSMIREKKGFLTGSRGMLSSSCGDGAIWSSRLVLPRAGVIRRGTRRQRMNDFRTSAPCVFLLRYPNDRKNGWFVLMSGEPVMIQSKPKSGIRPARYHEYTHITPCQSAMTRSFQVLYINFAPRQGRQRFLPIH